MPVAEIVAIGTELLLGEIVDTNTAYLARVLREHGIDLYRASIVGDNAVRISQVLKEAVERADLVITTGGLGPTVDDPTREAVAMAAGVNLLYSDALWDQIQDRFHRYGRPPTLNNQRQAYIPQGAIPVKNNVGTAPAFIVEIGTRAIISLPGVPREMEYITQNEILPYLKERYALQGTIKTHVIHTASAGESQIDELIEDLERGSNPTVGVSAHPGQVDIRITAKAKSIAEADTMIAHVAGQVRSRLGEWVYGSDAETLEGQVVAQLSRVGWSLVVLEAGFQTSLMSRLQSLDEVPVTVMNEPDPLARDELESRLYLLSTQNGTSAVLGMTIKPSGEKMEFHTLLLTPAGRQEINRSYGGSPLNAPIWAANLSLDLLRKTLAAAGSSTAGHD
jgi:competence/damage-inducible protein CinA-like protein